jgi:hypothetical protein
MRRAVQGLGALAVVGLFVWLAACGSSPTGPKNVSLKGNYTLTQFVLGGNDLSSISSGTLDLTDTDYALNMMMGDSAIVENGTYVATDSGTFSETPSNPLEPQLSGTYTNVNNLLTITATVGGIPVTQAWQKQ